MGATIHTIHQSEPRPAEDDAQFRLVRFQTFNWGTFSGLHDFAIPERGFLFVGPSGSGKSTILDAHAALLTPPKWVEFNVAAREADKHGKDRSLVSYLRGAWAQQTEDNGEHAVQYLRRTTTWSAIAETYRNPAGRTVVLAQVLWLRGSSTAPADVKRTYLVLQRPFELRELEFLAKADFDVRRIKHSLPDAWVRDEFSAYQERFRSLLGIASERALRLLHKTQSAKNLGDLNVFLRDFMLDPPETFATADQLVVEFSELDEAHRAVVKDREQIGVLAPARDAHDHLQAKGRERSEFKELEAGVERFRDQQRERLLDARIAELEVEHEGAIQEVVRLNGLLEDEDGKLTGLRLQREGVGGALALLEQQHEAAKKERPLRQEKYGQARAASVALGWEVATSAQEFAKLVAAAKNQREHAAEHARVLDERRNTLRDRARDLEREFTEVRAEIDVMLQQPSNIPAHMLRLRAEIAQALGLHPSKLPFVGELLEVKKEAAPWQGAIERVLHNFALSLLVDDADYTAVASHVNDRRLNARLVYLRMLPQDGRRAPPGPSSLVHKLAIAQKPQRAWLLGELIERFDYECADTMLAFRRAQYAVTQAGQIKSKARHEKDDRHDIADRRRWVLGFDNAEKRKLYEARAGQLAAEIAPLQTEQDELAQQVGRQRDALLHCQTLANLSWLEVDLASLEGRIQSLGDQVARERDAKPELRVLDAQIAEQGKVVAAFKKQHGDEELRRRSLDGERLKLRKAVMQLREQTVEITLTPAQHEGLEARFAATAKEPLTLESISDVAMKVMRGLQRELAELQERILHLQHAITDQFSDFNRRWAADSGGLDASLASAHDYFVKLARLESDGLPRHEERFFRLLREQSDQNLTLLSTRLDLERTAIRERLELVNESLAGAPFGHETHLVIETIDRSLEEVRTFKQSLKEALSQAYSLEADQAERRFLVLRALVDRLKSQDSVDRNWRKLVLDVREHVEFVARELDALGQEVEVYRSGAGKSGGQRQKLASTCLAAALRYQLGGQERSWPTFSTVVLDEAFDKADADFTTMAMNIFTTFGFQMIVATPLKSVMTLEPFIGGACFVHNQDRKTSSTLMIEYDEASRRLVLPESADDARQAASS